MKRREFIQSLIAGGAGLSFSLTTSASTRHQGAFEHSFPQLQTFDFETISVDGNGNTVEKWRRQAKFFREQLLDGVGIDMVAVDGQAFLMGAAARDPRRGPYDCTLRCDESPPFFMGKTAVTQEQWRAVARLPSVNRELDPSPACFSGDQHPVECVSWHDAQEFCARLSKHTGHGYRLPSEAEWEGACRAGTTGPFHFGATLTGDLANYGAVHAYDAEPSGAYRRSTTHVAQFIPNGNGLYDMHGNVWEWCADRWHDIYRGSPDASTAASGGESDRRTLRGGSWADNPAKLRSASRSGYSATSLNRIVGFRLALSFAAA